MITVDKGVIAKSPEGLRLVSEPKNPPDVWRVGDRLTADHEGWKVGDVVLEFEEGV